MNKNGVCINKLSTPPTDKKPCPQCKEAGIIKAEAKWHWLGYEPKVCPTCSGTGKVCQTCGGKGTIPELRTDGEDNHVWDRPCPDCGEEEK